MTTDSTSNYEISDRSSSHRGSKIEKPSRHRCAICSKCFTRAFNLQSHIRAHNNERPFPCLVCKKAFTREHDRNTHERLHTGEKKFICKGGQSFNTEDQGCGRQFTRASALARHCTSVAGRNCRTSSTPSISSTALSVSETTGFIQGTSQSSNAASFALSEDSSCALPDDYDARKCLEQDRSLWKSASTSFVSLGGSRPIDPSKFALVLGLSTIEKLY